MSMKVSATRVRDAGFTLIELLIVIVVLGILAGIVSVAVGSAREQAVAQSCKTAAATLVRAADNYYLDEGKPVAITSGTVTTSLLKYLKNMPPFSGTKTGSTYYLVATAKSNSITVQGKDSATDADLADCKAG